MTDVVVLHKFPGAVPGQVLPLDARTQKAVKAGNAKILPSTVPGNEDLEVAEPAPLDVARLVGTGHAHDHDEDTASGEVD